jgi:hypothetical protein
MAAEAMNHEHAGRPAWDDVTAAVRVYFLHFVHKVHSLRIG